MNARKLFAFVMEHLFITMSGLAALAHSMWTIDVFFAGQETDFHVDPGGAIFRKIIAFFIAASIDIGQIYTSVEIKHGHRTKAKYATFGFFALCTYILQYLFMAYHVPHFETNPGVSAYWDSWVTAISDASIWFIPILLPASTLLYTISQRSDISSEEKLKDLRQDFILEVNKREEAHLAQLEEMRRQAVSLPAGNVGIPLLTAGGSYRIACPECSWEKDGYIDQIGAENGLRSHKPHCKKTRVAV